MAISKIEERNNKIKKNTTQGPGCENSTVFHITLYKNIICYKLVAVSCA